jgi:prepilin-type N-terminal cleavage/methylation domain-containing protein
MRCHSRKSQGFTLVEMLTVVGIMAILAAILIGSIHKVRATGFNTRTAAYVKALQGAAEAYAQNFRSYPGPVANDAIVGGASMIAGISRISMSENLLLGVEGGLSGPVSISFNLRLASRGPVDLSKPPPPNPGSRQYTPFLTTAIPKSAGQYRDIQGRPANDSIIPEYLDAFPEPLPILYYRANRGAAGIAGAGAGFQYDPAQNTAYTSVPVGPPSKTFGRHGLWDKTLRPISGLYDDLGKYLDNPSAPGSARGKDAFVIIAAGSDRTYGTADDITSFGSVVP